MTGKEHLGNLSLYIEIEFLRTATTEYLYCNLIGLSLRVVLELYDEISPFSISRLGSYSPQLPT